MADVVTTQVPVRDLKSHLSQWLARVRAGEVVEITSHRRPIAPAAGDRLRHRQLERPQAEVPSARAAVGGRSFIERSRAGGSELIRDPLLRHLRADQARC